MSEEFNNGQMDDHVRAEEDHMAEESVSPNTGGNTTYSWVNPKITARAGKHGQDCQTDQRAGHSESQVQTGTQDEDQSQCSQESTPNGCGSQYQEEAVANESGSPSRRTNVPCESGYQYQQPQRSYYQVNDTIETPPHVKPKKKKRTRKPIGPMSMSKRWMVNISMAVVFGLVAGSVAYGVYYTGNKINGGSTPVLQNTVVSSGSGNSDNTAGTGASGSEGGSSVSEVAKNAMPSMVAISTETVETVQSFFGTYSQTVPASGSGVIVGQNDDELLIATNNHVIEGANKVSVAFIDDAAVEAQIKGTDADNDLAVVAVKLSDIPEDTLSKIKVAVLGDSDALQIGEGVVAIGNALGYGQSVTDGIVSAINRTVETQSETTGETTESDGLIQTNAAINPGNSGGALLNMKGELIGINEAKYSSTSVEGMGFAIPLAKAEPILQNLMNMQTRSKVSDGDASYIGITGKNVSSEINNDYGIPIGVLVNTVEAGGPAENAGIKERDVITSLDGRSVKSMTDLKGALEYYAKGETVEVKIQRMQDGEYKEQTVSVTLGDKSKVQITDESQQQQGANPFGR